MIGFFCRSDIDPQRFEEKKETGIPSKHGSSGYGGMGGWRKARTVGD